MSDADALYTERAHLVALLSTHYPSWLSYSDRAEPDWAVCFIETAQGQLTWHISPDDLHLFNHLCVIPFGQVKWDGHTTDEKYERIRARLSTKDPAPRTL